MSGVISFNPWLTTNAENSFSLQTIGATQGFIFDDPVINPTQISTAIVGSGNTAPLTGGWPLQVQLYTSSASREAMNKSALLATTNAEITAFSTFTYAENGIVVPGSDNAPLYGVGGTLNFLNFGTNARLVVQATPALMNSLTNGTPVNTQVSWNFTSNMLDVYNSTTGALPIKNIAEIFAGNALVVQQVSGMWKFVLGDAVAITL